MDAENKKTIILKNKTGQAIFEFLAFLPLLIFTFMAMITVGNALNASINQQKVTRRYFYYLLKGNSTTPLRRDLQEWQGKGISVAGSFVIGHQEKSAGGAVDTPPLAPCFKFNTFFPVAPGETCETPSTGNESHFLRTFTVYGLCGTNYHLHGPEGYANYHNFPPLLSGAENCLVLLQ